MKKLLFLTMTTNLILAAWITLQHSRSDRRLEGRETLAPQPEDGVRSFSRTSAQLETLTVTNDFTERFTWRRLESSDYKVYIANLRDVGCPEETIRDIIIADVDKLFAPRFATFRTQPGEYEFWKNDAAYRSGSDQTPEQRKQSRELYKEKQALLKELLGEDYQKEVAQQFGQAEEDAFLGGLPKDKRDQMEKIAREYMEKRMEVYEKAQGSIGSEEQDEIKAFTRQAHEELGKILNPQELFEYQVRTSEIARDMKSNELQLFDATETEFRAIFKAKQEIELLPREEGQLSKDWQDKYRTASEELKAALGEERYAAYNRAKDGDYQTLVRLAESRDLPRTVADQVFGMKSEVDKAARGVRSNRDLSEVQRAEALAAIRAEAERALTAELGERNFKLYRRNAYWLRNIAPRPGP